MKIQQFDLYDLQGALIKTFGPQQRELNVQHIAEGQYVLRILTDDGVISENVQVGRIGP